MCVVHPLVILDGLEVRHDFELEGNPFRQRFLYEGCHRVRPANGRFEGKEQVDLSEYSLARVAKSQRVMLDTEFGRELGEGPLQTRFECRIGVIHQTGDGLPQ